MIHMYQRQDDRRTETRAKVWFHSPHFKPFNSPKACHDGWECLCTRELTYAPSLNPQRKALGLSHHSLAQVRAELQRSGSLDKVQLKNTRDTIWSQGLSPCKHFLTAFDFNYINTTWKDQASFGDQHNSKLLSRQLYFYEPVTAPAPHAPMLGLHKWKRSNLCPFGVHNGRNAKRKKKRSQIVIGNSLLNFAWQVLNKHLQVNKSS